MPSSWLCSLVCQELDYILLLANPGLGLIWVWAAANPLVQILQLAGGGQAGGHGAACEVGAALRLALWLLGCHRWWQSFCCCCAEAWSPLTRWGWIVTSVSGLLISFQCLLLWVRFGSQAGWLCCAQRISVEVAESRISFSITQTRLMVPALWLP